MSLEVNVSFMQKELDGFAEGQKKVRGDAAANC
jgi:hypothetical protein